MSPFLSGQCPKGNIFIEKVASEDNIADILSLPLKRESLNYLRQDLTPSVITSEHNEEVVNAEGIFVALEDVVALVEVGSRRASSDPNDVVVALSPSEKGDGLAPSSVAGEKAAVNPFGI
ncbi:hypothetical protein Tco_0179226 [Tanacetum coccineum]